MGAHVDDADDAGNARDYLDADEDDSDWMADFGRWVLADVGRRAQVADDELDDDVEEHVDSVYHDDRDDH